MFIQPSVGLSPVTIRFQLLRDVGMFFFLGVEPGLGRREGWGVGWASGGTPYNGL